MNESKNWDRQAEFPLPPEEPGTGPAPQSPAWQGYPPQGSYPVGLPKHRRKRKFVAGLLAFFIPGIGHMYLGLMTKGIVMMLLMSLDITAIVYASYGTNVLSVVLLSLLLVIMYFYNLFDAIQSTDVVNDRNEAYAAGYRPPVWDAGAYGNPPQGMGMPSPGDQPTRSVQPLGIVLLAGAGIAMILLSGSTLKNWMGNSVGSMFGAIVLIGAGIGLWIWETKGNPHKRG